MTVLERLLVYEWAVLKGCLLREWLVEKWGGEVLYTCGKRGTFAGNLGIGRILRYIH